MDVKLGTKVVEVYLDYELVKTHLRGAKGAPIGTIIPQRRQPSSNAPLTGIAKEPALSAHQPGRQWLLVLGSMPFIIYASARES